MGQLGNTQLGAARLGESGGQTLAAVTATETSVVQSAALSPISATCGATVGVESSTVQPATLVPQAATLDATVGVETSTAQSATLREIHRIIASASVEASTVQPATLTPQTATLDATAGSEASTVLSVLALPQKATLDATAESEASAVQPATILPQTATLATNIIGQLGNTQLGNTQLGGSIGRMLVVEASAVQPATIGYGQWIVNNNPISKVASESRTWQELELSLRSRAAMRNNILKPLDSHSGSVDTVVNSDGSFKSFDRAGGSNTYTLTPPISRIPPRIGGDFFVDGYDDQMVDQEGNEYEVSLTLVDDESRSTSSGLSETRSTGEWLFEFDTGSVATSRVSQRVQSGSKSGEGTKQIELVLDPEQTQCLEESCTALEAVTVHEVADGPNFAVDESPGDVNTVAVTAPTGADSVLPSGSYAVNEWESEWVSEEFYRVSTELVELA